MSSSDLAQVIEQYHHSLDAVVKGDPAPPKEMFSRRDDVTLANPFGPPVRGWNQVEKVLDRAASLLREGDPLRFDIISEYATADLAYTVHIETTRAKVGAIEEIMPISLRVTTIFRREDDGWKIVHRHADAITAPQAPESIVQQKGP